MPYITETYDGDAARKKAVETGYTCPKFSAEIASRLTKLVLEVSSFSDPGADWERWDAIDADGNVIASRMV